SRTLDRSAVVLVLIGKAWLTAQDPGGRRRLDLENDWVRLEVARALERNIRVIPILVDGAGMPSLEYQPAPLAGLSRRQKYSVDFEDHDSGIATILNLLSRVCGLPLGGAHPETVIPLPSVQPSATSVIGLFEEDSTDNETLTVLAEHQLDHGRFMLAT